MDRDHIRGLAEAAEALHKSNRELEQAVTRLQTRVLRLQERFSQPQSEDRRA